MTWTAPTAAEFKIRYPAFTAVSDTIVNLVIGEAGNMVDDSWVSEGDYRAGIMLFTAHTLTLDGHGSTYDALLVGFDRIKSGTFELQRSAGESSVSSGLIGSTAYGRRFARLLARNKPAVAIV